jgi:hypothetical protein
MTFSSRNAKRFKTKRLNLLHISQFYRKCSFVIQVLKNKQADVCVVTKQQGLLQKGVEIGGLKP